MTKISLMHYTTQSSAISLMAFDLHGFHTLHRSVSLGNLAIAVTDHT